MVGGLCLRLTAGNVFCARSERGSPFFCLGRELWLKLVFFFQIKFAHAFFWCIWSDFFNDFPLDGVFDIPFLTKKKIKVTSYTPEKSEVSRQIFPNVI